MHCAEIIHGSPAYAEMVELRNEELRKPLGLSFTAEQLAAESEDWLLGIYEGERLCGCCILSDYDPKTLQLRQMAVAGKDQGKSVGRILLKHAESFARSKGFDRIVLHARQVAQGFYEKCGYETYGEIFTEVGIPHRHMRKQLDQLSTSVS